MGVDYWDSKIEDDEVECSLVSEPTVYIKPKVISKISFLMREYKSDEWAVDLIGKIKDGDFYIKDIYIFKQEVDALRVERKEEQHRKTIGVLHSHHTMGAFHSGTDDKYANQNHSLAGVVSVSKHDEGLPFTLTFTARTKTPCGKLKRWDEIHYEILLPDIKIRDDELKKIEKRELKITRRYYGGVKVEEQTVEMEKLFNNDLFEDEYFPGLGYIREKKEEKE